MKFAAVIAALLGATAVAAAPRHGVHLRPRNSTMQGRRANRAGRVRLSAEGSPYAKGLVMGNETRHVQYSGNWAGAVLSNSNGGYTKVSATITVPTPSIPSGGDATQTYAASAWVGIDGNTCQRAILQGGVDMWIQAGKVSFEGWYEWYPDYSYNFDNFAISAGNVITMTVQASSTSAGKVVLQNISTGQTVEHDFTGQSTTLCETDAEWILEDFISGTSQVNLANFGTIDFTNLTPATTGATLLDLQLASSGQVKTDCSMGTNSLTCKYV